QATNYSSSNSFMHTYESPGVYTTIIFVKDSAGNITKATFSVLASNPIPTPNSTATSSNSSATTHGSEHSSPPTTGSKGILAANVTSGPAPLQVTFSVPASYFNPSINIAGNYGLVAGDGGQISLPLMGFSFRCPVETTASQLGLSGLGAPQPCTAS